MNAAELTHVRIWVIYVKFRCMWVRRAVRFLPPSQHHCCFHGTCHHHHHHCNTSLLRHHCYTITVTPPLQTHHYHTDSQQQGLSTYGTFTHILVDVRHPYNRPSSPGWSKSCSNSETVKATAPHLPQQPTPQQHRRQRDPLLRAELEEEASATPRRLTRSLPS